ncbi:unnamed protein product [Protopolystoma xenopodis]|uniref:Uncharacterized protein n=1 Tax=Protopolystoma xenopodis TaxID=117903 RepID=A0A3S5B455_9PLAT|nr:unnamed protein product [Protopolystoma xenopodis]
MQAREKCLNGCAWKKMMSEKHECKSSLMTKGRQTGRQQGFRIVGKPRHQTGQDEAGHKKHNYDDTRNRRDNTVSYPNRLSSSIFSPFRTPPFSPFYAVIIYINTGTVQEKVEIQ